MHNISGKTQQCRIGKVLVTGCYLQGGDGLSAFKANAARESCNTVRTIKTANTTHSLDPRVCRVLHREQVEKDAKHEKNIDRMRVLNSMNLEQDVLESLRWYTRRSTPSAPLRQRVLLM